MLRTNLKSQVRQTSLPKWKPLLPLFEALMNAIQAVQERGSVAGQISIRLERDHELFQPRHAEDVAAIRAFEIRDNGAGFNDENFDSFNTAFSDYKLGRGGKGLGRFTWLKAFERAEIDSRYREEAEMEPLQRLFTFDEAYDPESALPSMSEGGALGTVVKLEGFKEPYKSECPRQLEQIAQRIVEHFLLVFMQGECPKIVLQDETRKLDLNEHFESEFRRDASFQTFALGDTEFSLYGFRISAPRSSRHKLIYAANDRGVVSEGLDEFIPNMHGRLPGGSDGSTFVYMAVVKSDYLDQRVNHARTDFDIAAAADADGEQSSLFGEEVKRSDIRNACLDKIKADLSTSLGIVNLDKEERIVRYIYDEAPHYKVLLKRKREFIDSISPNASKSELEVALHQELHSREVALKKEGAKIIVEASRLADYDGYQDRLRSFMEDFNDVGVSSLAQYVAHRRIIIDLLEKAISVDAKTGKFPLERVVHDIIFPMRSNDRETMYSQQNLWLIDESLNYHSFIASDLPLSKLDDFESDSRKRPDLVLFDRKIAFAEGEHPISAITLVEFKRPQRDDYDQGANPLDQVFEAVEDIRNGKFKDPASRPISMSNERVPAHCYLVCDITPSLKKVLLGRDATPTPDGQGYYGYSRHYNAYYEVIDYNGLLRSAKRRNRVLFDKLNILANA